MCTPDAPASSKPPLDIEGIFRLSVKLLEAFELIAENVGNAKRNPCGNHECLLDTIELIADASADKACELIEAIG
jgi:hypothetical protein